MADAAPEPADATPLEALRAAAAELRPRLEQVTFLAERERRAERWQALERVQRLFDSRLARVSSLARPPLTAVVGGTNVGKSTLYNLILGEVVARPSGTAAGTKAVALSLPRWWRDRFVDEVLPPWFEIREWDGPEPLNEPWDGDAPRLFVRPHDGGPDLALADTPDVDSVVSLNKRTTDDLFFVADAVIFVTSEQKYADEASDEYLRLAGAFGKAVLVVFNRTAPESVPLLDFRENKLPWAGLSPDTPVLAMPVLKSTDPADADGREEVAAVQRRVDALADAGAQVTERAQYGAAAGFAEAFDRVLDELAGEAEGVAQYLRDAEAAAEREAARYRPSQRPDDLDEAALQAFQALRVPGLDWAYEQLGLVRRKLLGGLRLFGSRVGNLFGRELQTVEDARARQREDEREQARQRLHSLLAELRNEVQRCPADIRLAMLERLPALTAGPETDAAVEAYLARVDQERDALIESAKQEILAELEKKGVVIRSFKAVARAATMGLSVTAMITTGDVAATDFAVAPVADAATKWVLDKYIGQTWREKLQERVEGARRELFREFLVAQAIGPTVAALPPSHREGFLTETKAANEALRALASGQLDEMGDGRWPS